MNGDLKLDNIDTLKSQSYNSVGAMQDASGIPRAQIETDEQQSERRKVLGRARLRRVVDAKFGPDDACATCRGVVRNDASFGTLAHAEEC